VGGKRKYCEKAGSSRWPVAGRRRPMGSRQQVIGGVAGTREREAGLQSCDSCTISLREEFHVITAGVSLRDLRHCDQ
jgi:hypothetical protein